LRKEQKGTKEAKITNVNHRIEKDWGDNEFYVDVTFLNNGENGRFMIRFYNRAGDKVDEKAYVFVKKGDTKTMVLDTDYSVGFSAENIGKSYKIVLYRQVSTGKYNEIDFVEKEIS